jgi:AraC-like DNA-binding protein
MQISRKRKVRFRYPDSFKKSVLLSLQSYPAKVVSARYEIPLSTLYRWQLDEVSGCSDPHDEKLDRGKWFYSTTIISKEDAANTVTREMIPSHNATSNSLSYRFDRDRARESRHVLIRLQRARALIEFRYFEHISCSTLAAEAQMSRDHFVRIYKQAYGESPYQHLIRKRANAARAIMRITLQPSESVAAAVGFESSSALTRAIHKFGAPDAVMT